jgi:predicted acetyltransferase
MDIFLDRVTPDKKDSLYRLLQYSLFEESATDGNEMTDDAVFEYKWFDRYFTEPERLAFFIREQGTNKLLGFAMINTHTEYFAEGHSVAEFMVLPKYRKQHIGQKAAHLCFDLFTGNWEASPSHGSLAAKVFWEKAIKSYTGQPAEFESGIFYFSKSA